MLDHYQILGVAPTASRKEIKARFKILSQRMHPDKGGSAEAYTKVKKAYDTLYDPQSRVLYDQGIRQGLNPQEFKTRLQATVTKLLPQILRRVGAHRGSFDQAAQFELTTLKSAIATERQQIVNAQKIVNKHITSIKKGQDTFFAKALIQEGVKINAALETIEISFAVLKFLSEDTNNMTCEIEELVPRFLAFQTFNQGGTGGTNW